MKEYFYWESTFNDLPKDGELILVQKKDFSYEKVTFYGINIDLFLNEVVCWLRKVDISEKLKECAMMEFDRGVMHGSKEALKNF